MSVHTTPMIRDRSSSGRRAPAALGAIYRAVATILSVAALAIALGLEAADPCRPGFKSLALALVLFPLSVLISARIGVAVFTQRPAAGRKPRPIADAILATALSIMLLVGCVGFFGAAHVVLMRMPNVVPSLELLASSLREQIP